MIIMDRWYLSCTWTCDSHSGPKAADHSINNVHTGGSFTLIQHMLMNYNVLSYLSQLLPFLMLQRNLSLNNELLTCAEAGGGGRVLYIHRQLTTRFNSQNWHTPVTLTIRGRWSSYLLWDRFSWFIESMSLSNTLLLFLGVAWCSVCPMK